MYKYLYILPPLIALFAGTCTGTGVGLQRASFFNNSVLGTGFGWGLPFWGIPSYYKLKQY